MSTRIHVGNLAEATTEETLRKLFAGDGRNVEKLSIVTDRETGRSKGFCFVQMGSPEETVAAIAAVNGQEVDGNALRVSEAKPRKS